MGPEVVIAEACRVDHIDDPWSVLMTTFRSTSRRLLAVALAIAAALTMAAGAAHSASAAPIVGSSGCRGDCGGGTLDCNRSDLDADVRAAYCDNVPTAEIDLSGQVVAQAP